MGSIIASAPGSLMLLGEHAVLHGRRALVMAVDQRLRVTLTPRRDSRIEIDSALGRHQTTLQNPAPHPDFRFIMEAIRRVADRLARGFDLRVDADFSHTIGFGSSAAVTAATVAALRRHGGMEEDLAAIRDEAIAIVRAVQGRGSGADVAASVHGGVVAYRAEPREVRTLAAALDICAVYCGYKTPTAEVIRRVEAQWAGREARLAELYDRIDACAGDGRNALEAGDLSALGAALNHGQKLMEALGVDTPELAAIVAALRADPGVRGAKISGSGLGDCAIGLGRPLHPPPGFTAIQVRAAATGLTLAPAA